MNKLSNDKSQFWFGLSVLKLYIFSNSSFKLNIYISFVFLLILKTYLFLSLTSNSTQSRHFFSLKFTNIIPSKYPISSFFTFAQNIIKLEKDSKCRNDSISSSLMICKYSDI